MVRGSHQLAGADVGGCYTLSISHEGRSEWQFIAAVATKCFGIGQTSASGLGAFANRDIQCGERILAEDPLLQWTMGDMETTTDENPVTLLALFNALSPVDRATYSGLYHDPMHGAVRSVYGVWLSNSYPVGTGQEAQDADSWRARAIFADASRFNHACSPNAHVSWNPRISKRTIHALQPIAKGVELTVSYLTNASGMLRDDRCEQLGFSCVCVPCMTRGVARTNSDRRRSRIGVLFGMLQSALDGKDARTLALVKERLALLEEEGDGASWDTMHVALAYCISVGKVKAAKRWAARAAKSALRGLGSDSEEYVAWSKF